MTEQKAYTFGDFVELGLSARGLSLQNYVAMRFQNQLKIVLISWLHLNVWDLLLRVVLERKQIPAARHTRFKSVQ